MITYPVKIQQNATAKTTIAIVTKSQKNKRRKTCWHDRWTEAHLKCLSPAMLFQLTLVSSHLRSQRPL